MGCLAALFLPVEIGRAVQAMQMKRLRIPFCWRCHLDHFLPAKELRIPILGFLCILAATLYAILKGHPLGFGGILVSLTMLIIIARKNMTHEAQHFPIQVYFENRRYRYIVWGGPLYDALQTHGSFTPAEPVDGT